MDEERKIEFCPRQTEDFHGYLWHIHSVSVRSDEFNKNVSGAETADSATIPEFTVVVVSLRYTFLCFVCVVFNASLFF
jgi:hypothetical protein